MGDWRSSEINISKIRVAGFGGAGMVVVALALVFELEAARRLLAAGLAGGGLIAILLVRRNRNSRKHRGAAHTALKLR